MRAAVYDRYGPPEVVRIAEVEKPAPRENEILVRIRATTVTAGDWRVRSLDVPFGFKLMSRLMFGITKPRRRILGTELAGEVESAGANVRAFKPGDRVFATGGMGMGCHAEYKVIPETGPVALIPPNLGFEEAAAIPFGGVTALNFLRRGKVRKGERVLVNGASGGVGTAVVQLARRLGAEVTGVCSAGNAEMVRSLGAARVVDYTVEDFTRNGETYDVIVDTVGTAPFPRCRGSLREGGRLLAVVGSLPEMLRIPLVSMTGSKRIVAGPATERAEDLRHLAELAGAGQFKPVIDRRYSFERGS